VERTGKWAIHISVRFQGINQQGSSYLLSRAPSAIAATMGTVPRGTDRATFWFHVEHFH
jgi:hypothetical protein